NLDAVGHFVHELVFDGSDVGLSTAAEDVDAFAVMNDGSFLISTVGSVSVPAVSGNGEDILRFVPTTLGTTTAGTWEMYVDGSDVGLSGSAENIDALSIVGGGLMVSTFGNFNASGLTATDKDLLIFTPTSTGSTSAGSFSMFLTGTSLGLTTTAEDLDAVYVDNPNPSTIRLQLSTRGDFSVPGLVGKATDVATATTTQPPGAINYVAPLTIVGALMGLKTLGIDALDGATITLPLTTGTNAAATTTDAGRGVSDAVEAAFATLDENGSVAETFQELDRPKVSDRHLALQFARDGWLATTTHVSPRDTIFSRTPLARPKKLRNPAVAD
ncbi:MAG TPA: hypothetical protein VIY86_11015, partial [Pirellulaceae bacterium]